MIGKHTFEIGAADFIKGMSIGADIADGGFSPETDAVNLIKNPGVLYAPADVTNKSTNLSGEALAWCPTTVTAKNGYILAADGKILSIDTSQALTASSALSGTYSYGTSDIAQFIDKIYATSSNDVARMDTDLTNGDEDWWSNTISKGALSTGVRHPLCPFQDLLWIGDKNKLHNIASSSSGNKDVLVLTAENEITALAVDPSSGKMLIAATQGANASGTISTGNRVFIYDGTSATYTRQYEVDGMITAFKPVGGIVYVFYDGNKIGYWNGSGITFLRKLRNTTLVQADLPYKHHTANIGNTLYVVDGTQVLAFGEVLPGRKVWYYALKNNVNSNNFTFICPVGSGMLGVGFATTKFYTFDPASVASSGTTTFITNKYPFPRPVYIRTLYVEFADAVANNVTAGNLYYKMEAQGAGFVLIQDAAATASPFANSTGASVYFFDLPIAGIASDKVRFLQFRYISNAINLGIRRISGTYDFAE